MTFENSRSCAKTMDQDDPLGSYRDKFHYPKNNNKENLIYLNALTVNIHLLLISFYQPNENRKKIIIERGTFPSDQYAIKSQIKFHGLDPKDTLIELTPRKGETTLRTKDILAAVSDINEELATVILGGVNYYTGQAFDMQSITKAGHNAGAFVGFDLAHGAGNLELDLHNWDVDFAAWCSYKYLCAGPGSPGGVFIHKTHHDWTGPRFTGWWGHNKNTRFEMGPDFDAIKTAEGWQIIPNCRKFTSRKDSNTRKSSRARMSIITSSAWRK